MSFQVEVAGGAALRSLRAGPARVFASFERSCYVETPGGIACLGGEKLGLGPLNAVLAGFEVPAIGDAISVDCTRVSPWRPAACYRQNLQELNRPNRSARCKPRSMR